jgi:hypothetical protein
MIVHDFKASLVASHAASDWPGWEPLYRSYFPTMVGLHDHRQDGDHQRVGIDRSIVLSHGKQILIDEKVRGRNKSTGKVYEDIFLEFLGDRDRRVPGWVVKPLAADYIAYLIAPLGICHLLPVLQLQLAWSKNWPDWQARFGRREVPNKKWITVGTPVPTEVLYPAIGGGLRHKFNPWNLDE